MSCSASRSVGWVGSFMRAPQVRQLVILACDPAANGRDDPLGSKAAGCDLDAGITLIDEAIGQSELKNRRRNCMPLQCLEDRATGTARNDVFLNRDEQVVPRGEIEHERL